METETSTTATSTEAIQAAERVYRGGDEALGRKDLDGAMRQVARKTISPAPSEGGWSS